MCWVLLTSILLRLIVGLQDDIKYWFWYFRVTRTMFCTEITVECGMNCFIQLTPCYHCFFFLHLSVPLVMIRINCALSSLFGFSHTDFCDLFTGSSLTGILGLWLGITSKQSLSYVSISSECHLHKIYGLTWNCLRNIFHTSSIIMFTSETCAKMILHVRLRWDISYNSIRCFSLV